MRQTKASHTLTVKHSGYQMIYNIYFFGVKACWETCSKPADCVSPAEQPALRCYNYNTASTETALPNEHMKVIDKGKGVVLLLLDLSIEFDTNDLNMLLRKHGNIVHRQYLSWFVAYIRHRQYTVSITPDHFKHHQMQCGFPQGLLRLNAA